MHTPLALFLGAAWLGRAAAIYYPLIEYSGTTFFDGWDFYGAIDNTTWGNVTYVTAADAEAESLAYVNEAGNAVIRVDNGSTVLPDGIQYRKSVRLTSQATFSVGTLLVIDALHMPYGCSVWPSIWMNGVLAPGEVWPAAGEIDIVEAINLMDNNQMALHSYAGCVQAPGVVQSGHSLITNCNDTTASGCTVAETKNNSFGAGFAAAGGGVFALQFDVAGIWIWFWGRASIPASITTTASAFEPGSAAGGATMNISDWGTPSAAYPASGCNITEFFPAQQLVVDITLCGLWAGLPEIYDATCPGTCFLSNIAGNGSNYGAAYFEIPSIRAYALDAGLAAEAQYNASGGAQTTGSASGAGAGASETGSADQSGGTTAPSGARRAGGVGGEGRAGWVAVGAGALVVLAGVL
ncbi:concanavalin A-like lectin/glucanase domain-containing protein [Mycena maculata]|uniref:Concanavalin A-like lectin/glucanase domain-containing protein n=1 Tax=Mycena maculata TaxID=230809 RepID=A0AAD7J0A3_9AGAR|nr:concanavalin A-like lectin/glucanase domain-containing protein [Mycena maculata]